MTGWPSWVRGASQSRAKGAGRSFWFTDEALKKAVAHAMRHSPAQQGSAAYDKERAERTWAAAVQVAGAFAARFA